MGERFTDHTPTLGLVPHNTNIFGKYGGVFDREFGVKIIFLNDENLEILKGYKAHVGVNVIQNELVIRITGFSEKGVNQILESLEEMKKEEIYSKKRKRKNAT